MNELLCSLKVKSLSSKAQAKHKGAKFLLYKKAVAVFFAFSPVILCVSPQSAYFWRVSANERALRFRCISCAHERTNKNQTPGIRMARRDIFC
jgi:hypothetical protein